MKVHLFVNFKVGLQLLLYQQGNLSGSIKVNVLVMVELNFNKLFYRQGLISQIVLAHWPV